MRKANTKKRSALYRRTSTETDIVAKVVVGGSGKSKIHTGIGLLDHMLELCAFWAFLDIELTVKRGDLNIDIHHTNEDVGIVFAEAIKKALSDKKGIRRIGYASVPMEDVVGHVVLDINGRGYCSIRLYSSSCTPTSAPAGNQGYEFEHVKHFLESFSTHLGMNLNVRIDGTNPDLHTTLEPVFKALGMALDKAMQIDPRRTVVPSTKGVID
jgi:imidazoleglycerol-phosphate dehydratase